MIAPYLPQRFRESVRLWMEEGVYPGSFLTAVLHNDLQGAFGYADFGSIAELPGIVSWFYNEADSRCWGSPEKAKAWHLARREERAAGKGPAI